MSNLTWMSVRSSCAVTFVLSTYKTIASSKLTNASERPLLPLHLEHQASLRLHNSHLPLPIPFPSTAFESNHLGRHPSPPTLPNPPQSIYLPPKETHQKSKVEIQIHLQTPRIPAHHAWYTPTDLPTPQIPNHRSYRTRRFKNKRHT